MEVLAADIQRYKYSNSRLTELGFSDGDLQMCADRGYSPDDVWAEVKNLMDTGLTTEGYARTTYFDEAHPEIYGMTDETDSDAIAITSAQLTYNSKGQIKCEISNFVAIMQTDELYDGIKFNEMKGRAETHTIVNGELKIEPWTDADEAQSMMHIEQRYGIYSKDKHAAALRILFQERAYNPIVEIVDGIKWDGQSRCRDFLHKWGKVDDTPYTQEVSRLIFAGGINRLYRPGCKFEDVPILMGDQGCGKSTLIRYLAINDDYFGELKVMEGQQAIEDLSGKWIMEIPEMSAFTKAKDQEAIKAFVSRQRDQYRKPYDRNPVELYRRCTFIASSNDRNPLVDKTGNRRWYPVELLSNGYEVFAHEQEIRDYIMQCWAEAREKLGTDEMHPYANKSLLNYYRLAQEDAMQDDWRVGAIDAYLERKLPGELTCVRELFHRALSPNPDIPKEPSLVESKDVGKILNRMKDWERVGVRKIGNYGKQNCWRKRDDAQTQSQSDLPFSEV